MKKYSLLSLVLAFYSFSMDFSYSAEPSNAIQIPDSQQSASQVMQSAVPVNWTRVKEQFKREKFLRDCDKEHNTEISQSISKDDSDYEVKVNDLCWHVLFKLRNLYIQNNDFQNKTFTYQTMAKFLLTYDIFPSTHPTDHEKQQFLTHMLDEIGRNITPLLAPEKYGKLKRWFHMYEGMLFLKYANMFATTEERRNRHIANAFHEFNEAIKLKTTKTCYLLAAETILDYGYTPDEMTRNEAENLAYQYIREAYEKEQRKLSKKRRFKTKKN